jgi:putative flippase GtrA
VRLAHRLLDRFVPARFHNMVAEVTKFGAVGLVNTALDYAVLNLFLSIGPLKAKIVSTIVATTSSYIMNRLWTWRNTERTSLRREYILFFGLNLAGLLIQLAPFYVAKYFMGFSESGGMQDRVAFNVANAVGIAIAMVFRFWAYRAFVFKTQPAVTEAEADLVALEVAIADAVVAPTPRHDREPSSDAEPAPAPAEDYART